MDAAKLCEMRKIQQTCSDFVFGDSKLEEASRQLAEFAAQKGENSSILFDVLSSIDIEVDAKNDKIVKDRMTDLCSKLLKEVIPDEIARINFACLTEAGASNRSIKMKTKLFYKQLKFNLLREETEGYGKLLVELCRSNSDATALTELEKIRCLIGQFNLDPNRILDVILDCFESYTEKHRFFLRLIRLYGSSSQDISTFLGFKFASYKSMKISSKTALSFGDSFTDFKPSKNFYLMIALLVKDGLIEIGSLYNFMLPKFAVIRTEAKQLVEDCCSKQKKLAFSSISATDKDGSNVSTFDTTPSMPGIAENYKLSLLWALCEVGEWQFAKQILDQLPETYAVSYVEIAKSICRLLDRMLDGLYKKHCTLHTDIQKYFNAPCALKPVLTDDLEEDFNSFLDDVRPVDTFEQLIEKVFPIAITLGPSLAYDPLVYTKLLRLCSALVEQKTKSAGLELYQNDIIRLFEETLVPSLSLFKDGCCIAEELWALLKQFPYTVRYRCYGSWKNIHMIRHPALILLKGEMTGKARYVIKRLTKETTKFAGRQLAKLGHSNPTVVFDYILNQIQQFENFIQPVVDALKWMTNLSYDVLAYCIIEHLSSPLKEKLKVSDGTLSPWLQSLATFVGSVFKKHNAELTGVLQYVANQLKSGKSFDLCVLREIVENMSGIETTSQLTHEQVEALAGGDILRQEGAYFNQIKSTKRSINRLKDALMQEDLVVGLCLLMSQQRYSIVYKEGVEMHLKLVGQMLDQCQETLVQFASFLSSNLKNSDYSRCMPSAIDLIKNYHLSLDAAMFLSRPVYSSKISNIYDELKKADRINKTMNTEKKVQHYQKACQQTLGALSDDFLSLFPTNFWQDLSAKLFTSFWTLTTYDIYVPVKVYERELEKIRKIIQSMDELKDGTEYKKKKEREQKLADEHRHQVEHVNRVTQRLVAEKDEWFLLSELIYPFFYSSVFIDLIFADISLVMCWMSENEANHYGRFLCATIEIIQRWLRDKEIFDKEFLKKTNKQTFVELECGIFPIYMTRLRNIITNEEGSEPVNYETYSHLVYKWQHLMIKSLMDFLKSGNYIKIRNALLLLIKVLPCYPLYPTLADLILKIVGEVRDFEKGKRQDLHVLAASYWAQLKLKRCSVITGEFPFIPPKSALVKVKQLTSNVSTSNGVSSKKVAPSSKPLVDGNVGSSLPRPRLTEEPQKSAKARALETTEISTKEAPKSSKRRKKKEED